MPFIKDKIKPTPGFVPDKVENKLPEQPLSFVDKMQSYLPSPLKQMSEFGQQAGQFQRDVATGVGKGVLSTAKGMSSLGERGLRATTKALLPKSLEDNFGVEGDIGQTSAEKLIPKSWTTPTNSGQKIGFYGEQMGEFFIPASMSLKAGKLASGAVAGGKILKGAAKLGATGLTEGVLGTGQSAMQSGELGKRELEIGAFSTVAPAVLSGAGKVIKAVTPTPVKELIKNTVNKVLRPGVKSLKNPKYYEKSEEAFYVLNKYKKDFDGVVRNPDNVNETLDTLKNAKSKIYSIYDDISKSSGELGAKFTPLKIMSDLSNWVKQTGYSQDVKEYAIKQLQSLSDLNGASPSVVQDRIEELNSGLNLFGTGTDKIKSLIDATIADRVRKNLDDLILNTGGANYQFHRNEYAALKAIEEDLARHAAILARKSENGLNGITDIFSGGDILAGVLTNNPYAVTKGVTQKAISEYFKWSTNPNTLIKKVFKALDKLPARETPNRFSTQKLLGPGAPGVPKVQNNISINLPERAPSTVEAGEKFYQSNKNIIQENNGLLRLPSSQPMITPSPKAKGVILPSKTTILPKVETKKTTVKSIKSLQDNKLSNLQKESSKYKNKEEFINSLDILFQSGWKGEKSPRAEEVKKIIKGYEFHGTNSVDEIKKKGFKGYKDKEYYNSGIYFTDNPAKAIGYMKQSRSVGKSSDVIAVKTDNFKIKDISYKEFRDINKGFGGEELISKLKKQGYDGIRYKEDIPGGETLIWNTNKLKNVETLTDIWNKSKK